MGRIALPGIVIIHRTKVDCVKFCLTPVWEVVMLFFAGIKMHELMIFYLRTKSMEKRVERGS